MDEPALYESRAWFQTTLSSIGDGVIATDRTGRVVFLNPSAAALTGWPDAEALGTAITTVVHLVDARTRAVVDNPVTTVLREGTVVGLPHQTLLIARDGVAYPIEDSAAPIRNPQGQLLGAVLVFRDITERQRADEAQARLAAIVDSADDAIISKTMAGIITSWNRGAEQLYGYTAAEMIGQPIARLIPPELADDFPRIMARLRRGERLEHYETQRLAKDGTRIDVALTISPLRDRTGQIIGASKIARDITARKQADAELARRRAETALLAALTQQLSASLELDTVLQRVARGAQTLCGSARVILALRDPDADVLVVRQAIGIPLGTYANVRLAPGQGLGGQVLRTGQPWRTEDYATDPRFEHVTPAAARVAAPWAVLAVPIRMDGQVEGVLYAANPAARPFTAADEAILTRLAAAAALALRNAQLYQQAQTDLADRQRAEAALAEAAATLEARVGERTTALHREMAARQRLEQEAQRVQHFALLGRLAAGVSHEIRNPLSAVFLHVDLLAEELQQPTSESPAVVAEALAEIKTQLARLEDLVQDYLALVRVGHIHPTSEDLGAAVQLWATEFQTLAAAQGVTLQGDGLATLGPVAVHAATLRRAVLNLVQNALEAMPQGGTLTLTGRRTPTQVQLQVQDTGSGIAVAALAQIFEPLYTTKPGGTGLGLYLVHEIVTAHGGQITVASVEGQGATFTVTLPVMPAGAPAGPGC